MLPFLVRKNELVNSNTDRTTKWMQENYDERDSPAVRVDLAAEPMACGVCRLIRPEGHGADDAQALD